MCRIAWSSHNSSDNRDNQDWRAVEILKILAPKRDVCQKKLNQHPVESTKISETTLCDRAIDR
jgi:hypothetical protein